MQLLYNSELLISPMANNLDLKKITKSRLKSVKILIPSGDYEGAVYMMGYVLECALKALICKRLNLSKYPDEKGEIAKFFKTHKFDPLLILSGLSNTFSLNGDLAKAQNWSDFTKYYPDDWPIMRYENHSNWDEVMVKAMYTNLIDSKHGILTVIKKRW